MVTQFPSTVYHPPTFSNSSETHFIRTPIPLCRKPLEHIILIHFWRSRIESSCKYTLSPPQPRHTRLSSSSPSSSLTSRPTQQPIIL
ncbi:hypothetical protein MUCCIDRAFT_71696 [Mucor lusitanicus CBS 277.49]|uniref:Uncharacterized protein n=1 Tax=Mucor lusitanicus CBS 277.49 TaxID=747725 RepID=A0A162ZW97_MUCCL|nr:hypothetical protein MUCCIDRAFT_71696 [Mucor lusitanicus CBS 277.49]